MELDQLTIEVFEPHIGEMFKVTAPDGKSVDIRLAKVGRIMDRVRSQRLKREPFAIYFESSPEFHMRQFTYAVSHPVLGELSIFIVPVSRDDGSYWYEAVFT